MKTRMGRRKAIGMGVGAAAALAVGVVTSKPAQAARYETAAPEQAGGQIVFCGGVGNKFVLFSTDDGAEQDFRLRAGQKMARSVKLLNVRAGAVIGVYASPLSDTTEDLCVIQVKQSAPEYTIASFERGYEDEYVIVLSATKKGIDGKVSRIHVS